jgi:hypothetical protein
LRKSGPFGPLHLKTSALLVMQSNDKETASAALIVILVLLKASFEAEAGAIDKYVRYASSLATVTGEVMPLVVIDGNPNTAST